MTDEIIGHGTWLDKLAHEMVLREESLGRDTGMMTVESGLGASGIPHVGSLGDAARAYGIKLALENLGYGSKLIAYSDDLDGLRKIPEGLPDSLEEHLAKPVSLIPDPFSCCDSYGMHMSGILLDGLDRVGIKYEFRRAYDTYQKGLLNDQIHTILANSSAIGRQIAQMVGQSKYQESLPYFPVCASCSRLYTAQSVSYVESERVVEYECRDTQMGGRLIRGCGHRGESAVGRPGDLGKLAWKVEFAARWAAFDVRFEAYGKDIMDSVKVNDWVAQNILGYAPPHHAKYEMFLDKGGKKISKSAGNVLTAQKWLEFGTPQSILLLLYKRITGARELGIRDDVPSLMDELGDLEAIYFGDDARRDLCENPARLARMRGLYLYAHLLQPPAKPGVRISYMLAVRLASMYRNREDRTRQVVSKLVECRAIPEPSPQAEELVRLAERYADEFEAEDAAANDPGDVSYDEASARALLEVASLLDGIAEAADGSGGGGDDDDGGGDGGDGSDNRGKDGDGSSVPDAIQTAIYDTAKSNGMPTKEMFGMLYMIILGTSRGPRIGPLIADMGASQAARMIRESVKG